MDHVPVRTNGHTSAAQHTERPSHPAHKPKPKMSRLKLASIAVGAITVLTLLLSGGWSLYQSSAGAHIDNGKYQAVFFTNGQVYFGKLQNLSGGYFKLTNIFYVQAAESKTDGSKNPQETGTQAGADVQLIKLGNEVHGPDDEMIISEDQVLFFENLKPDGKVSQSITTYSTTEKK
jgi:hypothetical protein